VDGDDEARSRVGKATLIADYTQVPAAATPVKTFRVNVAAEPG
jgi:hypothetical protein